MRIPIIAGNWKMNKTSEEALSFVEEVKNNVPSEKQVEAVVIPSDLFIARLLEASKGTKLKIGAQNASFEDFGSYTGETSPVALRDLGVDYVILGHSERRQYFSETNEDVNKRAHAVIKQGMTPIICVGETLDERESGKTTEKVRKQVSEALENVSEVDIARVIFAYEPIWAIGSGKSASAEEANATAQTIRQTIEQLYSQDVSEKIRIQYGGSVKPTNIKNFLSQSDIDGALVGGASLDPASFVKLLEAATHE